MIRNIINLTEENTTGVKLGGILEQINMDMFEIFPGEIVLRIDKNMLLSNSRFVISHHGNLFDSLHFYGIVIFDKENDKYILESTKVQALCRKYDIQKTIISPEQTTNENVTTEVVLKFTDDQNNYFKRPVFVFKHDNDSLCYLSNPLLVTNTNDEFTSCQNETLRIAHRVMILKILLIRYNIWSSNIIIEFLSRRFKSYFLTKNEQFANANKFRELPSLTKKILFNKMFVENNDCMVSDITTIVNNKTTIFNHYFWFESLMALAGTLWFEVRIFGWLGTREAIDFVKNMNNACILYYTDEHYDKLTLTYNKSNNITTIVFDYCDAIKNNITKSVYELDLQYYLSYNYSDPVWSPVVKR